jgi:hypothetical protein
LNSDSGSGSDAATITGADAATITGADADAASSTLLIHNAWAITWWASDIPNLTPRPPSITNRMLVPTWTPGEVIPDGKYDRESASGPNRNYFLPENAQWFLIIGMPIIGALLIGSCVFCCVRNSKKENRARRARQARLAARLAAAADANATAAAEGVPDAK